ncbi:putative disease resistance protein [Frankliniella fusca]|uniref:Disease resistance protein n=1 Tax=Frankliniella fusca TaxID=407009 RepID=A0AAE1LRD4_9NEOP|nr:putative disease resistance protein [Frankliniella fusca]
MLQPFIMKLVLALLAVAALLNSATAGPAAYGICQSGCNALAVACYLAAGSVMGVGSVPACDAALGVCMAACIAAGAAPTP